MDIPWAFHKHVDLKITNIRPVDLKSHPELQAPKEAGFTDILCCGLCKSDPIVIKIKLPKQAFVLGDQLSFRVSFDNKSG